jgi:hypothetical protein
MPDTSELIVELSPEFPSSIFMRLGAEAAYKIQSSIQILRFAWELYVHVREGNIKK